MKNLKIIVVSAVIFIGLVSFWRIWNTHHGQNSYTIGVLSVLSGPFAEIGEDFVYGIKLAQEEIKQNSGIELSLKIEDGKAEAKTSVSAFRRLLFEDPIATIVVGDNQVPAVAPLISENHIPTIATSTANSTFLEYNKPTAWIFRNFASITLCSRSIALFAYKDLHCKKAGVLYMEGNYGQESKESFNSVFTAQGGVLVGTEEYHQETVDTKSQVAKILSEKPDVIFVSGYGISYCATMNNVREMGFDGPILTGDSISNPESLKNVKNVGNVYFTNQIFPETKDASDFKGRFFARFNRKANLYAAYGYDSFVILAEAIINTSGDKNKIREFVSSIKNKKIVLGEISFEENGDCIVPLSINQMMPDRTQKVLKNL